MADDVKALTQEVYGDSWADTLMKASAGVQEQPETESEDDSEYEAEEADTDDSEDVEEQPEGDSESEEPEVEADPEYEIGEDKKPVKLSELKSGYMRQSDYTKKTNELASQRKELETQREGLKDAQSFKDHMEANPWLWEQVNSALNQFNETGILPIDEVLQDAQYGKYVNHLMAENNALKKQLESVSSEYEGVKLSNSMQSLRNDLKADYGDLVTDDYMESLQERAKTEKLATNTLKEIAEGHLAKLSLQSNKKQVKQESKKAEAKAIQKLAETKKMAPDRTPNVAARPSAEEIPSNASWGDFFKSLSKR